jgi:transposase-like protein
MVRAFCFVALKLCYNVCMAKYSDEEKAAVISALMAGQSVSSVSNEYKIPRGTVAGWSAKVNGEDYLPVSNTKREEIGDLILAYLRQNLKTLEIQAEFFTTRDWLERQGASELAVLHGVMTDKAVRLLEAMGANDDSDAA